MKKVAYNSRKDQCEKRLRIKGRFIKKEDQHDIMQRIFADEQLTQTNAQQLTQKLQDLVDSPNPEAEHLLEQVAAADPKELKIACSKDQASVGQTKKTLKVKQERNASQGKVKEELPK